MDIKAGVVARSAAGRDKNTFFVIMSVEGDFAYICDGRTRPLERQKKKNIRHLSLTASVIPESSLKTNKQIRKALHPYNFGEEQS
ncbi:MAG: KOW domain-containing RNA-binding protein [Acutalibacteraceae bacterium]